MPLVDSEITATDLCNQSLGMLGLETIDSIEGTDRISTRVKSAYVVARDYLLRLRPWNCATTRQALNAISNPSSDWGYAFQLPTDPYFLRVLGFESLNQSYRIEGSTLLSNESAPVLIYVCRIDAHNMDALLFQTLVVKLASILAGTLLKDAKVAMALLQQTMGMLEDASGVNDAESHDETAQDLTFNR